MMIREILVFMSGLVVGNMVGVFIMALVIAAGEDDKREGRK